MRQQTIAGGTPPVQRPAFVFGPQKVNVHAQGRGSAPRVLAATPSVPAFRTPPHLSVARRARLEMRSAAS
jgi:hypothetical protein